MRYNRYLYRLPVQAVPITDIVKNSISSADIVTDPIIGTSLVSIPMKYGNILRHFSNAREKTPEKGHPHQLQTQK